VRSGVGRMQCTAAEGRGVGDEAKKGGSNEPPRVVSITRLQEPKPHRIGEERLGCLARQIEQGNRIDANEQYPRGGQSTRLNAAPS